MTDTDDDCDLVLEADNAEGQCGFVMYGNSIGYPVGRDFFNAHLELFVACHVAGRDRNTGWDVIRFATKEPPTDETIGDIASQIIESSAAVRVGCYFGGKLYRPRLT